MILAFSLDYQLDNVKTVNSQISLMWGMNIGKILFTLSYVKYIKQFDFNLLVNGKSKKEKYFLQYYKNFRQFMQ